MLKINQFLTIFKGCPALSIPIKLSEKGLPISIQLMAPNFQENMLLEVGAYVENAVNFSQFRSFIN